LQMSGSKTVAEDVTQEVFLFLMRDGHVFDPEKGSVSAFLLGVARNYVLRRLRVEQQLTPLGDDFDDDVPVLHASTDICPLEDLTRAETIESVRRAVLSLPSKYREVVVLCELQDISYGETAEILGCAIGTVRSRLHRARALLLAKLRPAAEADDADSATVKSARCFA
ncbi:MAG TPA: RNA polymerase sigma factor, partial [Pyrinomonadaceae bacterium]|nr:RNA polymerase sigma factor [Pyrinomonadaceae bacterium]